MEMKDTVDYSMKAKWKISCISIRFLFILGLCMVLIVDEAYLCTSYVHHYQLSIKRGPLKTKSRMTNYVQEEQSNLRNFHNNGNQLSLRASIGSDQEWDRTNTKSNVSAVARWHSKRRRAMIERHPEIISLESSRSILITLPLLILSNVTLTYLSVISGSLNFISLFLLAFGLGSVLSLWQLQILHEVLHGSMLGIGTKLHRTLHRRLLFLGSLPSAFGYWLYLQYGHLSHHRSVGNHSLNDAFTSSKMDLADGDVLFVNHRMNMKGESGPKIKGVTLSIGRFFYQFWKEGDYIRNGVLFSMSFLLERMLLMMNDVVVAFTGRNFFFPNKPIKFHNHVALYTRVGFIVRATLCVLAGMMVHSGQTFSIPFPTYWLQMTENMIGPFLASCTTFNTLLPNTGITWISLWWSWNPILFLMLSETLWSLPPHPASAMFITNHGSKYKNKDGNDKNNCEPSGSTYAGKWYSILTLGTNYHVEHHDFPTMPLNQLGKLKGIAGTEFYGNEEEDMEQKTDDLGEIMKQAFSYPDFYACSNAADLSTIYDSVQ